MNELKFVLVNRYNLWQIISHYINNKRVFFWVNSLQLLSITCQPKYNIHLLVHHFQFSKLHNNEVIFSFICQMLSIFTIIWWILHMFGPLACFDYSVQLYFYMVGSYTYSLCLPKNSVLNFQIWNKIFRIFKNDME